MEDKEKEAQENKANEVDQQANEKNEAAQLTDMENNPQANKENEAAQLTDGENKLQEKKEKEAVELTDGNNKSQEKMEKEAAVLMDGDNKPQEKKENEAAQLTDGDNKPQEKKENEAAQLTDGDNKPEEKKENEADQLTDKENQGDHQANKKKRKRKKKKKKKECPTNEENEMAEPKEKQNQGECQANKSIKRKKKRKRRGRRNNKKNEANKEKEASKDDAESLVEKALKSFCCYLYVGKGHPYYKARPWNDDDSYPMSDRMRNLEVLASNAKTELVPINKIKLAMDNKLVRRPETLMFALAMCARQTKSEKLRAAAYYFLAQYCPKWEYFALFIKYASMLCKTEGISDEGGTGGHTGSGRGWKNAVNKWYLQQGAYNLRELVMEHKGDHGWTHKDILKLSHIDTLDQDVETRVIMCYVMRGLAETEEKFMGYPEALQFLSHIRLGEEFKRCKNPASVVASMDFETTKMKLVHPAALKNKEVWERLLPTMDIRTVLEYLPKLCDRGYLTKMSKATKYVVQCVTDKHSIEWNKILPGDILTVLNRYELGPTISRKQRKRLNLQNRMECLEKAAEDKHVIEQKKAAQARATALLIKSGKIRPNDRSKLSGMKKKYRAPPSIEEPDMRIRDALRTALALSQSVDITGASPRTYLVGVRLPGRRRISICGEVALSIALPLMHRAFLPDDSVTVMGYEPRMKTCVTPPITFEMSFDDALNALYDTKRNFNSRAITECYNMPLGPVEWACVHKKKYDVIINVTNEPPTTRILDIMGYYRHRCNMPQSRLINVVISRVPFELKGDAWHDCLTINGNDPHVPWIIEAYCRGLF